MTKFDKTARWLQYADSESGPLGRHLDRLVARRQANAAVSTAPEPSSLAALIPIGMLTLFMLWAVINPV